MTDLSTLPPLVLSHAKIETGHKDLILFKAYSNSGGKQGGLVSSKS